MVLYFESSVSRSARDHNGTCADSYTTSNGQPMHAIPLCCSNNVPGDGEVNTKFESLKVTTARQLRS